MARPRYAHLFSPTPWRWVAALPEIGRRVLFAGISSPERLVRRRQMFTNILAGVAAFNALLHLAANAAYELEGLLPVHIYNAVMVVFSLANHRCTGWVIQLLQWFCLPESPSATASCCGHLAPPATFMSISRLPVSVCF